MREVGAELRKTQNENANMSTVMNLFTVTAPEGGMVIYDKGWDGKAIKAGSRINIWDPTVATLPDLTRMLSKTYVNEVDVRKVKAGQDVAIGLDAYPDKRYKGHVTHVANVGEQRPNSDAKVFEVTVELEGTDNTLRPSMTTSNKIITSITKNSKFIPLECLHNQFDSITYIFKQDGLKVWKQEVIVGETNTNDAVIVSGVAENERVFLSVPAGMENDDVKLLPEMNGKRKRKDQQDDKPAAAPAAMPVKVTAKN